MVLASNSVSTGEAEAEGWQIQGLEGIWGKYKASLANLLKNLSQNKPSLLSSRDVCSTYTGPRCNPQYYKRFIYKQAGKQASKQR